MIGILFKAAFLYMFSTFLLADDVYDSQRIADIFYELNGDVNDPRKKVNHTKGFCASGNFAPSGNAKDLFKLPILNDANIPTIARFSLGGGDPNASDKGKSKGLALKLAGSNDAWEIVMLNTEINFAKDLKEFGQFFEMRIPKDGKVDTKKVEKMLKEVKSYRNFENYLKTKIGVSPSVANIMYHSIHTFFFVDSKTDKLVAARWKFIPLSGEKKLSDSEIAKLGDNYLEDVFKKDLKNGPVKYKMVLVLANPNDIINDTTALWSGKHKEVEVGVLSLDKYDGRDCNFDVFLPSILPQGIEPPKDPLFETRNIVYGITFGRRQ